MTTIALVGCAHIHTPAYIDVLLRREDTNVAIVWDHDEHRAQAAAGKLGAKATADIQEVWENADIDAVVICSETPLHRDHVLDAIRCGKAAFVEKPVTLTAGDAVIIAEEAIRANTVFHTGFFLRYHPAVVFLREAVRNGAFGQVTRIRGSISHAGGIDGWFDDEWRWMADPAQLGPDYFHDLGIHMADLLTWISGPVDRVVYETGAVMHRYAGLDEYGVGMLRFRDGHLGVIEASSVDRESPNVLQVHGTDGFASVSTNGLVVQGPVARHLAWSRIPALTLSAGEALVPFLDVLNGTERELVSAADAAQVIAVMDAFTESKQSGSWTEVVAIPE